MDSTPTAYTRLKKKYRCISRFDSVPLIFVLLPRPQIGHGTINAVWTNIVYLLCCHIIIIMSADQWWHICDCVHSIAILNIAGVNACEKRNSRVGTRAITLYML